MDEITSQTTIRDYVCAHCYGHLVRFIEPDGYRVECYQCGSDQGYVTKAYAERRRLESIAEKAEVTSLLQSLGVLPKERKSNEQILSELGF